MSDQAEPLIEVREDERFLAAQRDLEAALIYARPFGQSAEFKDRAEANAAADALKALKDHVKAAEDARKQIKTPYKATGDHIDREYRELLSRPQAAIEALNGKGVRFVQRERRQQEEERKAEEARLAKEAEAKAEAAAEAARKAEAEAQNAAAQKKAAEAHNAAAIAAVAKPTEKKHPKQLRGDIAAFGTTTTLRWEVTDLSKLAPEHLTFNKKSIDAAVKAEKALAKAQNRDVNLQCLPGVTIWTDESGVSRGPRS